MVLRTTDGTQLSYAWKGSDYQCTQIKDRNGNFITVNYTSFGRIDTVVDTLARTIKFNYDVNNFLTSITQTWTVNGQAQQHVWATFAYNTTQTIQTNFSGLTNVGPQNNSTITVLSQVTLNDNSRFNFDYTSWGQIWKISNFAEDNHLLNYRSYNLPLNNSVAQNDCPRFTERRDWAENWNRSGPLGTALLPAGPEQEVINTYAVPVNGSWTVPDGTSQTGTIAQVTLPDNTYHKIYFAGTAGTPSGWQRSLTSLVETYDSGNVRQRQSASTWTQDDTNVSYSLNPRVTETNVYDPAGNRARTSVTYQAVTFADGTSCRLPQDVFEYQANATTVLRRTHTDYNLATTYTDRRIIGLVSEKTLYEVDPNTTVETLMAKVGFQYDEGSIQGTDAPVQHDNTNYPASFLTGRANLSSVKRYNASDVSQFTTSTMFYNTAGAVVKIVDPANHPVLISYTDQFSADGTTLDASRPSTLAYPTMVTDPDNYTSNTRYHYDFGTVTWKQTPQPNTVTNLPGPQQTVTYDSFGRIQRVTNLVNGAYTRYVYPSPQPGSQNRVDTYTTIVDGASEQNGNEAHSFSIADGYGRVIASASSHPDITVPTPPAPERFSGQLVLYNNVGRAIKTSNPTETYASGMPSQWAASGDDVSAGWLYTQQAYDWKGRPLITTNTDLTTKEASYSGCGCAGGQVVTLTDEGTIDGGVAKRRQQVTYADVLGRTVKTEVLNWQGGSVYTATVNTYNARDQVTLVRQYQGPEGSATYQDTTMSYDGFGRLKTKHVPEQDAGTATTYNYNSDDTVQSVTDARGATQTLSYNGRHLLTNITYTAPAGITVPAPVGYGYDAAGNRTSMTDGLGPVSYAYDQLSRLSSETRTFSGVGTFPLSYSYNLASELTSITDSFGAQVGYNHDQRGKLTGVTGSGYGNVSAYASNIQYRAWGAMKHLTYGNNVNLDAGYNARLQVTSFSVSGVMGSEYQYTADGRMRYARDLSQADSPFDRGYSYDHVGHLVEGKTGAQARGLSLDDGPYQETFGFNVWGNLTARSGTNWAEPINGFAASYTNNRRQGWTYDADGRPTQQDTLATTYDAAGHRIRTFDSAQRGRFQPGLTLTQDFDGNGARVKQQKNTGTPTYFVRASALGGAVLTEVVPVGGAPVKTVGYVYAAGQLLAKQEANEVRWVHIDPRTENQWQSNATGGSWGVAQVDPLGIDAGFAPPPPEPLEPSPEPDLIYPKYADMFNGSTGCTIDGAMASCDLIAGMPEGSFTVLPPGVSTIQIVIDHNTGDLQIRGTDWVINSETGEVSKRKWVDEGVNKDYEDTPGTRTGIAADTGEEIEIAEATLSTRPAGHWKYTTSPQNPSRVPLSGDNLQKYKNERDRLLRLLRDRNSECSKFLLSQLGLSGTRIARTVSSQRPFDATASTLSMGDAGLNPRIGLVSDFSVKDFFAESGASAGAAVYARSSTGATLRDVYYAPFGLYASSILHESLHIFFGPLNDPDLATRLGATSAEFETEGSLVINRILGEHGCR